MAVKINLPAIQPRRVYAPAIQLTPKKEKNFFQKIIEFIGSFFYCKNFNSLAKKEMKSLFKSEFALWKEVDHPGAEKSLRLIQQFLIGERSGSLEQSCFRQLGISTSGLMDPVFLDLAVHKDPADYLRIEKGRLNTYRIQLLQLAADGLIKSLRRFPNITERLEREIIERASECTAVEVDRWIQELRKIPQVPKLKAFVLLDQIVALMHQSEETVDGELTRHFLNSLKIHEKLTLQALPCDALSKSELRALEIISQKLSRPENGSIRELGSEMESKRVFRFLDEIAGNLELNQRLLKYAQAQHMTISKQAVDLALDLSYKLASPVEFFRVMGKVRKLEEKIRDNQPSLPAERLSLKELRQIESLSRLHGKFVQLEKIGTPMKHPLVALADKADQFVKGILEKAEEERPHKSSTSLFYDFTNARNYHNWPCGWFRRICCSLIKWPLVHAAIGIRQNNQNMLSHMWQGHHILHRRSIGDYAFKTFELDFSKIITQKGKQILEKKLGSDWKVKVEKIYEEIAYEIHNNKELLSQFYYPSTSEMPVAVLNLGFGDWENHAEEDRHRNKQQTCSSFVLNLSLETMVRLEERLKERCNADLSDMEQPIPADYRFFNYPIRKNRLLDFILPHQLARKELSISREVEKPAIIRQILQAHEFEMR